MMRTGLDFAPGARHRSALDVERQNGVGTALSEASPIWFTLSHGILNEVYYPRIDSACTRDLGFVVTGPEGYFSEEKRDCVSVTRPLKVEFRHFTLPIRRRMARSELRNR